jgi:hypothetical protein
MLVCFMSKPKLARKNTITKRTSFHTLVGSESEAGLSDENLVMLFQNVASILSVHHEKIYYYMSKYLDLADLSKQIPFITDDTDAKSV